MRLQSLIPNARAVQKNPFEQMKDRNKKQEEEEKPDLPVVTFQTSSLGRLGSKNWALEFYAVICGKKFEKRGAEFRLYDHLKIVFPTKDYVYSSHIGAEQANSVICHPDYWND